MNKYKGLGESALDCQAQTTMAQEKDTLSLANFNTELQRHLSELYYVVNSIDGKINEIRNTVSETNDVNKDVVREPADLIGSIFSSLETLSSEIYRLNQISNKLNRII